MRCCCRGFIIEGWMIAFCHDCSEYETCPWFWSTLQYSGWNTLHIRIATVETDRRHRLRESTSHLHVSSQKPPAVQCYRELLSDPPQPTNNHSPKYPRRGTSNPQSSPRVTALQATGPLLHQCCPVAVSAPGFSGDKPCPGGLTSHSHS